MKSEVHHPFVPMYYSLVLLKTHFLAHVSFTTVCCVSEKKNLRRRCSARFLRRASSSVSEPKFRLPLKPNRRQKSASVSPNRGPSLLCKQRRGSFFYFSPILLLLLCQLFVLHNTDTVLFPISSSCFLRYNKEKFVTNDQEGRMAAIHGLEFSAQFHPTSCLMFWSPDIARAFS
jgi:hypothetical protein